MSSAGELDSGYLTHRDCPWDLLRFSACIPDDRHYCMLVAWPAYAWRALVPRPMDESFDALQRAVLRLAMAGKTVTNDVAQLLDTDPVLAHQVQESCMRLGFLDNCLQISEAGKAKLIYREQDSESEAPLARGWVLRDAIGGHVIPQFHEGALPYVSRDAKNDVIPLPFDRGFSKQPSAASILGALRTYRKMCRYLADCNDAGNMIADLTDPADLETQSLNTLSWDQAEDEDDGNEQITASAPTRVIIIGTQPERVDIETYVYITNDNPTEWNVRSPWKGFGGGWLKARLARAMQSCTELSDYQDLWLSEASRRFPESAPIDEYEARIASDFPEVEASPDLRRVLEHLALAYKAEDLFKQDIRDIDVVLLRYGKSIEILLQACLEQVSDKSEVPRRVRAFGFSDRMSEIAEEMCVRLPPGMRTDKIAGELRQSVGGRGRSLAANSAHLFLHAYYNEDSAFRQVLKDEPSLLMLISEVAWYRNRKGAHDDPMLDVKTAAQKLPAVVRAAKRVIGVISSICFGR